LTSDQSLTTFQTEWEQLVDKAVADYSSLTSDERIWFNIQALIGDVENGGAISHYYNSGADRIFDTIEDLNSLGYADLSEVLEKINSLFPDGTVIADSEQRNKVIETWDGSHDNMLEYLDTQFFKIIPQLESSLVRFINNYIILMR
jgi:Domain of unknown function (DUF4375)